jgi:hypothetical protein
MEVLSNKQPATLSIVQETNTSLQPEERRLINLKYADKKIGRMNDLELRLKTNELLIKINVITGWSFPLDSETQRILKEQFFKKLKESYSDVNVEEIEYAFRNNTEVKDWGKNINLFLIDEVMKPYLEGRYELSAKEERQLPPPKTKPWSDEDIKNLYRSQIEEYFQALKKGYNPIRHKYYEETLREDGMIPENENMDEFLVRKLATANNLYLKEK